ncbi:MAG: hypothetical protein KDD73_13440 [Anaerolineales bacterium]|nr:hypothetical protein [Anaerolineales bacterium]
MNRQFAVLMLTLILLATSAIMFASPANAISEAFIIPYGHAPSTLFTASSSFTDFCVTGPDQPIECFSSESEALYIASKGQILLAVGQTTTDISSEELSSSGIKAILYEHTNHTGAALYVTSSSCSGWNNLSPSWSDRVTSVWTGGCGVTLFEHFNLTGPSLSINAPGTYYVGAAMNDKASSWSLY